MLLFVPDAPGTYELRTADDADVEFRLWFGRLNNIATCAQGCFDFHKSLLQIERSWALRL